jgi:hypothetical protein
MSFTRSGHRYGLYVPFLAPYKPHVPKFTDYDVKEEIVHSPDPEDYVYFVIPKCDDYHDSDDDMVIDLTEECECCGEVGCNNEICNCYSSDD